MSDPSPARSLRAQLWLVLFRLATLVLIAFLVGALLNGLAARVSSEARPAGFWKGIVQGAFMPMAFPTLLLGRDVTVYSTNNTGIDYKLGYTAGVNVCGAIFFGILFLRLRRWRRWAARRKTGGTTLGES